MDKFDQQIAMLKPTKGEAQLDEKLFIKQLVRLRRAQRMQRWLITLMALAIVTVIAGAVRRDIWDVLTLTFRYFGDLPSILREYLNAYLATISWPSIAALLLLATMGTRLLRMRHHMAGYSQRAYQYAFIVGILALGLGITGLLGSSAQAEARQEALRRSLNARGHLEVQVSGKDYELYGGSDATDASIRAQAFIEELRHFDISQAYPELTDMASDGIVAEIRSINPKDGCVFYVERRLETTSNKLVDANAACIYGDYPTSYLNAELKPIKPPKWKVGQAFYYTSAHLSGSAPGSAGSFTGIIVLLDGKADQYVAHNNTEKLVPKGQPGTGVQSCGIHMQETCPQVGSIEIFTNAEGHLAYGEIGSSIPGDSLKPRANSVPTLFFGQLIAMDSKKLQIKTSSGKTLVVSWPSNVIEQFNSQGASQYHTTTGQLNVQLGDHLLLFVAYADGMDVQQLSISDVQRIDIAIKTSLPDPLEGETYYKKDADVIEKY